MSVTVPTSSNTFAIDEPIRSPYSQLTRQQLDALDMAEINSKEVTQ